MSAAFFVSRWGINAGPLGRHDAGIALALALATAVLIYVSLAIAALVVLAAAATRHSVRLTLLTLCVSLLPIGYLWLLDALAAR